MAALAANIKSWARSLGFQYAGITGTELDEDETHLLNWLAASRHGEMAYMRRHGTVRSRPAELVPGTLRIISVRMDYWPPAGAQPEVILSDGQRAYISRYALGRDYHKSMRKRLQRLADRIQEAIGPFGYRAFVDSAPVLEKALARNAGVGWIGKHTNLLDRRAGSWFFLGELYTDLPLPLDTPARSHCGSCSACLQACPTAAFTGPYELDARRCIAYLTIEHPGAIPLELRPLMGNRIYGCDDCQMVCPWNRFAQPSSDADHTIRHGLDNATLISLFSWSEAEFDERLRGSAIRRIGHERWLRNIAVAMGNAPRSRVIAAALRARSGHRNAMVREHVGWALARQGALCGIDSAIDESGRGAS